LHTAASEQVFPKRSLISASVASGVPSMNAASSSRSPASKAGRLWPLGSGDVRPDPRLSATHLAIVRRL